MPRNRRLTAQADPEPGCCAEVGKQNPPRERPDAAKSVPAAGVPSSDAQRSLRLSIHHPDLTEMMGTKRLPAPPRKSQEPSDSPAEDSRESEGLHRVCRQTAPAAGRGLRTPGENNVSPPSSAEASGSSSASLSPARALEEQRSKRDGYRRGESGDVRRDNWSLAAAWGAGAGEWLGLGLLRKRRRSGSLGLPW